ncbi:uncharacterized protein TNCV_4036371 [Trichonephila clavipes]|nr:uncharacterized protein TNCV_4036371 [Trichonephila clavipes]
MASGVLADLTRALQGTNRGRRPAIADIENDVGSLEQFLLYTYERYLAEKLPLGDHLGKVVHGAEEYHQRNVGPLRRSCRCSGAKGSARTGRLDLRLAFARCLEIVCGTFATPSTARIVKRVTVGSTSACRTILRSSLLVDFLVTPDPCFYAWGTYSCPLLPTISNGTLRAIHLASNTVRRPACSFNPDDQASLTLALTVRNVF